MIAGRCLPFVVMLGPLAGLGLVAAVFRLPIGLLLAACLVAIGETALLLRLVRSRGPAPDERRMGQGGHRDAPERR